MQEDEPQSSLQLSRGDGNGVTSSTSPKSNAVPVCQSRSRLGIALMLFVALVLVYNTSFDGTTVIEAAEKEDPSSLQQSSLQQPSTPPDIPQAACGVYYYYHVSKNGGSSIMQWQKEVTSKSNNGAHYVQFYEISGERDYAPDFPWRKTLNTMNETVHGGELKDSSTWLSVHHHHRTPGLRFIMPTLRKWRAALAQQGCSLLLTTTLREPVSRMKSLVFFNHIPLGEFDSFVRDEKESQVYYLLYNTCEPMNAPGVPPTYCDHPGVFYHTQNQTTSEIEEVIGYLREFDKVGRTSALDDFIQWSMEHTGWELEQDKLSPHSLSSNKPYNVTAEMEQLIVDHSTSDLIFWDRVGDLN